VASQLNAEELDVAAYHAGLDPQRRNRVLRDWSCGGTHVVVATIAFGMGGPDRGG
jgi:superfamily II DNA helicase RecQ